ncbi:phytoene desaturase family protein [Capillimicrobium parvum]|uniref:Pyridine nucleotide-disulfide oxidoreductase domain-containing protein 2 n=1 Tax=Capillimicrobium parvum TaxID=2884022 RepID=A0A9E6Y285_9ACTN|nr:NAD(P)/FAD-dependent oxidoreductase [Capillimicrobium parvum]UGS38859.1 All-trans-zeta-carotene desaturase [Capillimicrobium parvum]
MTSVLVIGAGHQGLVAAIHLASAGLDVTVLEHAAAPGGATRSAECTLPGFVHDLHAGFLPMTVVSPAIRELEILGDVDLVTPHVAIAHPFPDGTSIALHTDVEATIASLGPSGRHWREAMDQLLPLADTLAGTVLSPLPPVACTARLAAALRTDGITWGRRMIMSAEALGLELFEGDRRATAWLAASAQHSGLPPDTTISGAFGFLLQLVGQRHGWPLVRGGTGRLVDALVRRATGAGAQIRCDAAVEGVLVERGRAAGARLATGERIRADAVLSTISALPLARLLPPGALPGRLQRRLAHWRYGTGAFKIDYALSAPAPWTAPEARESGVVHVAGELEELARSAQDAQRGVVPQRPALVVGQQSLHDDRRAPAGQHTLYVYAHVPSRYDVTDEDVADRIEAQLERFAPGLRDVLLARAVRSPAATERDNPSLVGGDLGGGSYELDQQLIFRPAPGLSRYRTPLRGLYVAGASTHPGGAVQGVSGRGAARALLSDRRLRRWRAP